MTMVRTLLLCFLLLFSVACTSEEPVIEEVQTTGLVEQLESEGYILIDKLKTPQNATNLSSTNDTLNQLAFFLNATS